MDCSSAGLVAVAGLLPGVQGLQHLPVHLDRELGLLRGKRRAAFQVRSDLPPENSASGSQERLSTFKRVTAIKLAVLFSSNDLLHVLKQSRAD